ncbi:hypothetical protein CEQ90_19930 [Lewinellaceae bacterium SD302]|nr:hypothetical protein CEQ90_19930 [Lewinellaceae bacterium SD302]
MDIWIALIGGGISILLLVLGGLGKAIFEPLFYNFTLRQNYKFEQRKKLKDELALHKGKLLNAAEQLNYRLLGFNSSIGRKWHKIEKNNWFDQNQYYLNSFIYRILLFGHYLNQTENSVLSIDTKIADNEDILYLKFVKSMINIFSDVEIHNELEYKNDDNVSHIFKDDFETLTDFVVGSNKILKFSDFKIVLRDSYDEMEMIIKYLTQINDDDQDVVLNTLRCLHLLILSFLNKYGHEYQITEKDKMNSIYELYGRKIKVKNGFNYYLIKSKLESEVRKLQ